MKNRMRVSKAGNPNALQELLISIDFIQFCVTSNIVGIDEDDLIVGLRVESLSPLSLPVRGVFVSESTALRTYSCMTAAHDYVCRYNGGYSNSARYSTYERPLVWCT